VQTIDAPTVPCVHLHVRQLDIIRIHSIRECTVTMHPACCPRARVPAAEIATMIILRYSQYMVISLTCSRSDTAYSRHREARLPASVPHICCHPDRSTHSVRPVCDPLQTSPRTPDRSVFSIHQVPNDSRARNCLGRPCRLDGWSCLSTGGIGDNSTR